jgi:uncharacterized protein HemX
VDELIDGLVSIYIQTGFMALFSIVALCYGVWYLTKGRKEIKAEREAIVVEIARNGKIIENCTAVINNNSKVIEQASHIKTMELEKLTLLFNGMDKQGELLEELQKNQMIFMERQKLEYQNKKGG